jgi:hypothetical protein
MSEQSSNLRKESKLWKLGLLSALLFAIAFYFWPSLQSKPTPLIWPSHITEVGTSGALVYGEIFLDGSEINARYDWHGVLQCHPISKGAKSLYRCKWKELEISSDDLVLIGFREDGKSSRYWSSEELTHQKRAQIYRAFGVDLSHHDANNDTSLFQMPIVIGLDRFGSVTDLRLAPSLQKELLSHIESLQITPIVNGIIRNPSTLPNLHSGTQQGWKLIMQQHEGRVHHLSVTFNQSESRRLFASEQAYTLSVNLSFFAPKESAQGL